MGSSTLIRGNGLGSSGQATVSPIETSSNPARATISPAFASSISILFNPLNPNNLFILPFFKLPSSFIKQALWPFLITPL